MATFMTARFPEKHTARKDVVPTERGSTEASSLPKRQRHPPSQKTRSMEPRRSMWQQCEALGTRRAAWQLSLSRNYFLAQLAVLQHLRIERARRDAPVEISFDVLHRQAEELVIGLRRNVAHVG